MNTRPKLLSRAEIRRRYRLKHADRIAADRKRYRETGGQSAAQRRYVERHKDQIAERAQQRLRNADTLARRREVGRESARRARERLKSDPDAYAAYLESQKPIAAARREKLRALRPSRRVLMDPISKKIARNIAQSVRRTIVYDGGKKAGKTAEIVGASTEELRAHLESLFKPGMAWSNYGLWEIDHVKPVCRFDLRNSDQQRQYWHYTNLQPLWKTENRKKAYKYEEGAVLCLTL